MKSEGDSILKKKKILIIDGSDDDRNFLKNTLSEVGYRNVICSSSFEEAVSELQTQVLDLIVTEWRLPDGCALDHITAVAESLKIPIIFVTNHGTLDVLTAALDSGASGFIVKPTQVHSLLEQIKNILIASCDRLYSERLAFGKAS